MIVFVNRFTKRNAESAEAAGSSRFKKTRNLLIIDLIKIEVVKMVSKYVNDSKFGKRKKKT